MTTSQPASGRSSMSDTVCGSGPQSPVIAPKVPENEAPEITEVPKQNGKKEKKQKNKANKQQGQQKKPKAAPKVDKPYYQTLGEDLVKSTRLHLEPIAMPPMPFDLPPVPSPFSERRDYFSTSALASQDPLFRYHSSASTLALPRPSTDSTFSGMTQTVHEDDDPAIKAKVKGAIYTLRDFAALNTTEELVLRHGRVAHMGVRDRSYKFWMNSTRTAVVHFKVLNKVAVLGGDPLCPPERLELTMSEFRMYCRQVGWKTAVIGGSTNMAALAKEKGWTCMNFGTERVLNPQTNEVLVGKSGKRIATQCRQLLDPARGGISIHTYIPSYGRNPALEASLRNLYDDWRNERNNSGEAQAFVTVFDLFSMNSLMTFIYTTDKDGQVNGFAALRRLGAVDGYHIDPFIQNTSAPRGVSDLLIYASLSYLNALGCSYLSLGYEPVTQLDEIWGLPTILHSTTRKVYRHVFGKIPVGGKEAFHARWKPDDSQDASLYLCFVGKMPSPKYMLAMTHFANISLRKIVASDWQEWKEKKDQQKPGMGEVTEVDSRNSSTSDLECLRSSNNKFSSSSTWSLPQLLARARNRQTASTPPVPAIPTVSVVAVN